MKTEIDSFKSMIESCYTYGGVDRNSHNFSRYLAPYKDRLGEAKFNEVFDAHVAYLEKNFTVAHGVYTDSEGCTYSSLISKTVEVQ